MAEIIPIHLAIHDVCQTDEERARVREAVDEGKIGSWGKNNSRRLNKEDFEKFLATIRPAGGHGHDHGHDHGHGHDHSH